MADEEIVTRHVENRYLPNHLIMTVGEEDFENGIWQAIYMPIQYETEIEQIIILDVTGNAFSKTDELVKKFEAGYIPEK
jgi:hypothetical protein